MSMPSEVRKADIFHSVITDGMKVFVQNNVAKKLIVMNVKIQNGRS